MQIFNLAINVNKLNCDVAYDDINDVYKILDIGSKFQREKETFKEFLNSGVFTKNDKTLISTNINEDFLDELKDNFREDI